MERSRQSARECRARKKLRYDYLEEIVLNRERAVEKLLDELRTYENWCQELDRGLVPCDLQKDPLVQQAAVGGTGLSPGPSSSSISSPVSTASPGDFPQTCSADVSSMDYDALSESFQNGISSLPLPQQQSDSGTSLLKSDKRKTY